MRRSHVHALCASVLAASALSVSRAEFLGFDAELRVEESDGVTYHVIDVYAMFSDPADKLLNIFDATLYMEGAATDVFYNASIPGLYDPSALPAPLIPPADEAAYAWDSFITIGLFQDDLGNSTTADPGFSDADFVNNGELAPPAGWYNSNPNNSNGVAGIDLRVLVGRFSIEEAFHLPGARITWDASAGYTTGGVTKIASESRLFFFRPSPVTIDAAPEDLDGDSKGDVIWHNANTGGVTRWFLDGLAWVSGGPMSQSTPTGWIPVGTGDLDGDGEPDVIFRDPAGAFHAWFLVRGDVDSTATLSNSIGSIWQCLAVRDLDADGRADLLFRNANTGEVRAWLMDAEYRWLGGLVAQSAGLEFLGVADLDASGSADILWRLPSGVVIVWLMDGLDILTESAVLGAGAVGPEWTMAGSGDLDGDGDEDIVWRNNATGAVSGWLMNGITRTSGATIVPLLGPAWSLMAVLDLDADGDDDLLWKNAVNGKVNGWIMQGLVRTSGGFIKTAPAGWSAVTK